MQALDQQNPQSVVDVLATHAPTTEQLHGEGKGVAALDVVERRHSHLRKPLRPQRGTHRIDPGHSRIRKNSIGVGDIAGPVGKLHVGHLAGLPRTRADRRGDGRQQHYKDKTFHILSKDTKNPAKKAPRTDAF